MTEYENVTVIGAGDMGHGFVVHFAAHGLSPTLLDHRQSNLDEARERIADVVDLLDRTGVASLEADDVLEETTFTLETDAAVADADLVLAAAAPADAVLASNTSGIPVTDIGAAIPDAADRLAGCHWWNPPYLLTPVEVVAGKETTDETVDRVASFLESVDRDPIRVEKDVPGFVWNRVQFAVFRECLHLLEAGVASADDINRAIRDGYATRTAVIGPFETIDVNGIDLVRTVAEDLVPELSNTKEPSPVLDEYLDQGHTGVASGRGFFTYDRPAEEVLADRDADIAAVQRSLRGEE
jgi:3-hydroxyacyl-CoA dehydrogenase